MCEPEHRFAPSERPTGPIGPCAAAQPRWWRVQTVLLMAIISSGMGGCGAHGAPSYVLFGAYFPAWMLVAGIGILAAAAARVVMVATGLAETVPFQLLSCTAIGVTTAIVFWLLWFAQ